VSGLPAAAAQRNAIDGRPPTIDGVGPSRVALPAGAWATMLDFLVDRFPAQGRAEWVRRMRAGKVLDDDGRAVHEQQPYRASGRLYYYRACATETAVTIDAPVLFRNDHLLVVDKPHGMPVVPSGGYLQQSLLVRLRRTLGVDALAPIHRIDRDTAGLVMFSLQAATRDAFHALFRLRRVHKTYEAVAPWRADLALPLTRRSRIGPGAHFLQQCELPGDPNAETRIERLASSGTLAHYRLHPVTGQRHQLRVHMAALGLPIIGDGIYPCLLPEGAGDPDRPLQLLARAIAFTDPVDGSARQFTSQRTLALADAAAGLSAGAPGCRRR
jgi:tRNA pseudouridine32 synthase/23S rRNA pseudouridine746 synthase